MEDSAWASVHLGSQESVANSVNSLGSIQVEVDDYLVDRRNSGGSGASEQTMAEGKSASQHGANIEGDGEVRGDAARGDDGQVPREEEPLAPGVAAGVPLADGSSAAVPSLARVPPGQGEEEEQKDRHEAEGQVQEEDREQTGEEHRGEEQGGEEGGGDGRTVEEEAKGEDAPATSASSSLRTPMSGLGTTINVFSPCAAPAAASTEARVTPGASAQGQAASEATAAEALVDISSSPPARSFSPPAPVPASDRECRSVDITLGDLQRLAQPSLTPANILDEGLDEFMDSLIDEFNIRRIRPTLVLLLSPVHGEDVQASPPLPPPKEHTVLITVKELTGYEVFVAGTNRRLMTYDYLVDSGLRVGASSSLRTLGGTSTSVLAQRLNEKQWFPNTPLASAPISTPEPPQPVAAQTQRVTRSATRRHDAVAAGEEAEATETVDEAFKAVPHVVDPTLVQPFVDAITGANHDEHEAAALKTCLQRAHSDEPQHLSLILATARPEFTKQPPKARRELLERQEQQAKLHAKLRGAFDRRFELAVEEKVKQLWLEYEESQARLGSDEEDAAADVVLPATERNLTKRQRNAQFRQIALDAICARTLPGPDSVVNAQVFIARNWEDAVSLCSQALHDNVKDGVRAAIQGTRTSCISVLQAAVGGLQTDALWAGAAGGPTRGDGFYKRFEKTAAVKEWKGRVQSLMEKYTNGT